MLTSSKLPTLKHMKSAKEIEIESVSIKKSKLDKNMLESQIATSPSNKKNKENLQIPMMKENYLKILGHPKTDEEIKELDDNDIIDKLTHFTGFLKIWNSLPLRDQ